MLHVIRIRHNLIEMNKLEDNLLCLIHDYEICLYYIINYYYFIKFIIYLRKIKYIYIYIYVHIFKYKYNQGSKYR